MLERAQKVARIKHTVEAAIEAAAGRHQIEWRRDSGACGDDAARVGAMFSQPFEQRIAAERYADRVDPVVVGAKPAQQLFDLCTVSRMIGTGEPVWLAAAATKMHHRAAPAERDHLAHQAARIVAARGAFAPVEQDNQWRVAIAHCPVDVDGIAVVELTALAPERRESAPQKKRRIERLQMPAGQPPRCAIRRIVWGDGVGRSGVEKSIKKC